MIKITLSAGSTVFAKNVLGDSMLTPLFVSEIALYDIDHDRLRQSEMMLNNINNNSTRQGKSIAYKRIKKTGWIM